MKKSSCKGYCYAADVNLVPLWCLRSRCMMMVQEKKIGNIQVRANTIIHVSVTHVRIQVTKNEIQDQIAKIKY